MENKYTCYCGLYCGNCAIIAKIGPAAKILYDEMRAAGFEHYGQNIPGSDGFWSFLKSMAEDGVCVSCKDGSGDPTCKIRKCAQEKSVEMCAFCGDYPCALFGDMFKGAPLLEQDNALLLVKGWEAWAKIQDGRRAEGFVYR